MQPRHSTPPTHHPAAFLTSSSDAIAQGLMVGPYTPREATRAVARAAGIKGDKRDALRLCIDEVAAGHATHIDIPLLRTRLVRMAAGIGIVSL